jgi:hypothetical protein
MPKVGTALQSLETLWPAESKQLGEEGTVSANIRISASGCSTESRLRARPVRT